MNKIDFVLLWVDGNDSVWQQQKNLYLSQEISVPLGDANGNCRFRDHGLLRYWFRSVERFAPWVNKVFFVTCGQKPEWLDESYSKLCLVNHKDFIPAEYLPTFHSNTIELNLHRIDTLSEHFVLFNDDMFLLQPVNPDFFFINGDPLLSCDFRIPYSLRYYDNITRIMLNNYCVLQTNLDICTFIRKNWRKYFNIKSMGFRRAIKNMISIYVNKCYIPGQFCHLPYPHLKSTFAEIWKVQPNVMDITSRHKFRHDDCVNHWLACAWNLTKGHFSPVNEKHRGEEITISSRTLDKACRAIRNPSYPQICLNDTSGNDAHEKCFSEVQKAFQEIFPNKSSFEKDNVQG